MASPDEVKREELWNSISHGIGIPLGIAALVVAVAFASLERDIWKIVSVSIYGTTLVLMYTASTVYHAISGKAKRVWNLLDHSSIFLLIAGTYTPVILAGMRTTLGWVLFGVVWSLAVIGIVMKAVARERALVIGTVLYAVMGWLIVVGFRELVTHLPPVSVQLLFAGGLAYTIGILFFAWRRRYMHFVWHLFVLAGSALHFFAVLML
ncbi:MAG TPA: hemolysin III family protein [Armatimonadota bacterium]|jgi:hemolysin III|nr:hemolysin III family protein [Armatimonadota bacterium]HOJ21490.1 hemolysin III family protein [Armatimonadota bacterium]HOM81568.1 hemolysin III family protein [Armatimonadota bacterium]HOQ28452.1 hemolysin III family protein [Armatimonadota bacterium]HPO71161.1 hemolysin III family protein [Armatimonadota bacterium]